MGRALARLCTLALDPLTAPQVPDELRISGNAVTYEDVRDLIAEAKGVQKGEIKSEDLEKLKHKLRDTPDSHVVEYIRCVARSVRGAVRRDRELTGFWQGADGGGQAGFLARQCEQLGKPRRGVLEVEVRRRSATRC